METTKTKKLKKREPRPVGMPWLIPYLTVRDVAEAINFYENAFGFDKSYTMEGQDGRTIHGSLKYQGMTVIMVGSEGAYGGKCKSPASTKADCPINLYVYCPDIDALYHQAKDAGAKVVSEPADMFWGDRTAQFEDPDGYRWTFATNVGKFDASKAPKS
jgi:uncharacterized glyoxalase superfamily protein PhnB